MKKQVDTELLDEAVSGSPRMFQDLDRLAVDVELVDEAVFGSPPMFQDFGRLEVDAELADEGVSGEHDPPEQALTEAATPPATCFFSGCFFPWWRGVFLIISRVAGGCDNNRYSHKLPLILEKTLKADNLEKSLVCKEIACAEPVDEAVPGKHALSE